MIDMLLLHVSEADDRLSILCFLRVSITALVSFESKALW